MATPANQKKKSLFRHPKSPSVDGNSGMSAKTKRHFDHVRQKMLAFVDRQQRLEIDAMQQFEHHPRTVFLDQQKAPQHRTPQVGHRNMFTPALGVRHHQQPQLHQQLPHLALATPQVDRRGVRRSPNAPHF